MTTEVEVTQIIANLRKCVEASEAKDKYIKQLEMQADRTRAQIAAKDAELQGFTVFARGQIAAKDAALAVSARRIEQLKAQIAIRTYLAAAQPAPRDGE